MEIAWVEVGESLLGQLERMKQGAFGPDLYRLYMEDKAEVATLYEMTDELYRVKIGLRNPSTVVVDKFNNSDPPRVVALVRHIDVVRCRVDITISETQAPDTRLTE